MKRKALQENLPTIATPMEKRKVDALIANSVKRKLNHLKYSRNSNQRMQRRQFASSLSFLKKYKLLRKGAKMFGVPPKIINTDPSVLKYRNAQKIPTATRTKVSNYYEMHSVELPDQKHISKRTLKKTRVLEKPINLLFTQFREDFPELKVGASVFFALRPKHVKTVGSIKFRGCLCEYCENVELKLKILNFNSAIQGETECHIRGVDEAAQLTMCGKGTARYNNMKCINRKCNECGSAKVREHLKKLEKTKEVEWFRWETNKEEKMTKSGMKTISRKVKIVKKSTLQILIDELQKELEPMSHHFF
ncbi:hypothetical protein HOLleu_00729 [Holothuria leucospilota]|uniref:Uncharacterized protein n=1 Tax=Holothuria leucospilota TaxID=206669 RepID=A0A9Q1HKI2_HOLLE|nr:hypothetical protein HOLleu_00729 [Holothuria leucospilota]